MRGSLTRPGAGTRTISLRGGASCCSQPPQPPQPSQPPSRRRFYVRKRRHVEEPEPRESRAFVDFDEQAVRHAHHGGGPLAPHPDVQHRFGLVFLHGERRVDLDGRHRRLRFAGGNTTRASLVGAGAASCSRVRMSSGQVTTSTPRKHPLATSITTNEPSLPSRSTVPLKLVAFPVPLHATERMSVSGSQ